MQNSLLLDLSNYFNLLGLTQGDGVDTFRDFSPESPDSVIVLYEYKGSVSPFFDSNVSERSIQVTVRDPDADIARLKAIELFKSLQSENKVVHFNENRWGQVTLRQTPFKIKQDNNDRIIYGFNVGITTTVE